MLGCLLAGTALAAFLVVRTGWQGVADAVAAVGWTVALVVVLRGVALSLAGIGWGSLVGRDVLRRSGLYIRLRIVREGINALLPVMQVGGDIVGARLLARRGIPADVAGASVLVDILVQAATQLLFGATSFVLLLLAGATGPVVHGIAIGLLVAAPALVGFFLAQRLGGVRLVERLLVRLGERWPAISLDARLNLHEALAGMYGRRRQLLLAALIHLAGWLVGVGEVWVTLAAMGHGVDLRTALVIEGLTQAARGAAFAIPSALGVQEGLLIVLGQLLGISATACVALSLVKRIPDLALGLPGLVFWYITEAKATRANRVEAVTD